MAKLSAYELEKQANIARNRALLEKLGLDKPAFETKEQPRKKAAQQKKRKAEVVEADADSENTPEPPAKVAKKAEEDATPREGVRRSSRNSGKKIDYKAELKTEVRTLTYKQKGMDGKMGSEAGMKRKHNPKIYGSIPGIQVGTWWETREGCSVDAIHAPWVGGISGGKDGAHSVALSGGYDDDVDLGYAFTYTGSGGRDLKGTKNKPKNLRTAPQSSHQTFDNTFNKMLLRSSETRKPVRVIRGYKLRSKYAPSEGYRYDGLYIVEKAWVESGLNAGGFKVCKYAFKRLPNQPPLTVKEFDPAQEANKTDSEEEEEEGGGETAEADEEEETNEDED